MKLVNLLSVFTAFALMSLLCSMTTFAQGTEYYFGSVQKLSGGNSTNLYYTSNNSSSSTMVFRDKEDEIYGKILGSGNGNNFGLTDGAGSWSYRSVKDNLVSIHISGDEKMRIISNGNIGMGTSTPQHKLDVCGTVRGKEVIVEEGWCDYVFDKNYDLPTLEEEKQHIETAGYLLGFESEEQMAGEINVGDVTKRQQQKIEEQMLHIIDLNELVKGLVKEVETLKAQIQK